MTKGRNPIEELLAEGMSAIEQSFTMAKAAQGEGGEGDLDDDLKGFDQAKDASDAAQDEGEGEDGGDADGHEGDSDWNGGAGDEDGEDDKPAFAKAYEEVDALPLLQAIDDKLSVLGSLSERLTTLEAQNATLAKAVQESARGNHSMAKAVAAALNTPLPAKSKTAARTVVPTRVDTPAGADRNAVMSKAVSAVEKGRLDVEAIATFEVLTNQRGVDAALALMPHVAAAIAAKE